MSLARLLEVMVVKFTNHNRFIAYEIDFFLGYDVVNI